jgi:hypothetical protein
MGIEFTVGDIRREPGGGLRSMSGPLGDILDPVDAPMVSVRTMVDNVLAGVRRSGEQVSRLNIRDHGDSSGIQIGDDVVAVSNLQQYAHELGRLRDVLAPGAVVHLQHCEAAQNPALLVALARIWDVPVWAGAGYDTATTLGSPLNVPLNTGAYARAFPDGTFDVSDFRWNIGPSDDWRSGDGRPVDAATNAPSDRRSPDAGTPTDASLPGGVTTTQHATPLAPGVVAHARGGAESVPPPAPDAGGHPKSHDGDIRAAPPHAGSSAAGDAKRPSEPISVHAVEREGQDTVYVADRVIEVRGMPGQHGDQLGNAEGQEPKSVTSSGHAHDKEPATVGVEPATHHQDAWAAADSNAWGHTWDASGQEQGSESDLDNWTSGENSHA